MLHRNTSLKAVVAFLLIDLLPLADQVESFKVLDCSKGEQKAQLKSVSISSCPGNSGDSCVLKKGENASIDIDFETGKFNYCRLYIFIPLYQLIPYDSQTFLASQCQDLRNAWAGEAAIQSPAK